MKFSANNFMETKTAYDLNGQGGGGFVTFETGETLLALQLIALEKATLEGVGGRLMKLEFTNRRVDVSGSGLREMFEHLVAGRVKVIRVGKHEDCRVERIELFEE